MSGRAGILTLLVCCAAGCRPQASVLWIEPNSTAEHLVFGIGETIGGQPVDQFGVLRVYGCDGPQVGTGAMWVLAQVMEGPPARRVAYGEPPPGYRSEQGPRPLVPGCYQAIATTGGIVEFYVLPTHAIREVEPRIRWGDNLPDSTIRE
jgi:hypothetical protein